MKPGATKLLEYLQEHKALKLEHAAQIDRFWSERSIHRFVSEYSNVFAMEEGVVMLKEREKQKVIDPSPFVQARAHIVGELERFLVGPFEEQEVLGLKKSPMALYLTGKLVPFGSTGEVVNEEENDIATKQLLEDEEVDEMIIHRHVFRPSTMGFSFKMKELRPITIYVSFGMYDEEEHKRTSFYKKCTFLPGNATLSIDQDFKDWAFSNGKLQETPAQIRCKVKYKDNLYHVGLFFMNSYKRDTYPKQSEILFQTKMAVHLPKDSIAIFSSKADSHHYEDELLYRHVNQYAIGHGVGVDWQERAEQFVIESKWLPFYELPIVEHRKLGNTRFIMKDLSERKAAELRSILSVIPNEYELWLEKQEEHVQSLDHHLQEVAKGNIKKIKRIIERIQEGISYICKSGNEDVLEAFRFANKAMLLQQAQSKVALHYRSKQERIQPMHDGEWRLFQIAFLLMNIAGAVNPQHKDRDVVDLIWFPTGGGKTEAYLGVAAFVMSYRRLTGDWRDPSSYAGVTVFMRYTLRLLTTQQFQRATALICAAEWLRQEQPHKYGTEPFRIGLWIGATSSPNTYDDAMEKLQQIMDGNEVLEGNPMQVTHCPWCGTELRPEDYSITDSGQTITCHYYDCDFSSNGGIPALTIDEAIYQYVPTIVIGTVDKVAQIAWKKDMYELFGEKTHYHSEKGFTYSETNKRGYTKINRLKPPELIIQDELHLISGPLGSMTGLYELVVDFLCQQDGVGPKIIASTATIRGAQDQIRRLYGREVEQFPLPVQAATDNFVSYEVPTSEKPGRLYLGICSPGVSGKIHSVHVYAALLSITRQMQAQEIDPYWTILGYFNTVKDLAGTTMLFKDEIPVRLKLLIEQMAVHEPVIEEMTSRRKAREIPELLSKMEKTMSEEGALDAVLATNMISVGVDINRLGLMVMHNQPKTSSEYIQATSRVGRSYPGLVLTVFNSLRSRDLSHYERFKAYHSAMYRHVEPTSVTSFAQGSRSRGLTGVVVGAMRQGIPAISKEQGAGLFEQDAKVEEIKRYLIDRAARTEEISTAEIETEIDALLAWWSSLAEGADRVAYRKSEHRNLPYLLKSFGDGHTGVHARHAKPAMQSLRNVEKSIKVSEVWEDE